MKTEMSDGASPIELTIMICTFHRETLLLNALRSASEMPEISSISCEFVVVDNSDEGTARTVVERFASETSAPLKYINAHPANISVARNAGLDVARGTYIAMIDDDMTMQPGWLKGILPHLREGKYDVLFGPVVPVFEDQELATRESRQFFHRDVALADGAPLIVLGAGRPSGFSPGAGNAILQRATCIAAGERFDERYGRLGGEDTDFFFRLERRRRSFGWAANAATNEFVPIDRCSDEYLQRRSFVGGQIFAATYVRNTDHPALTALKVGLIASVQLVTLLLISLFSGRRLIDRQRANRVRLAGVRGKLSWRRMVPFYGDAPNANAAK